LTSLLPALVTLPVLFYLHYSREQVVSMNISAGRVAEAIAVLSNAPIERVLGLIYKTAPVLIAVEPEATVHMLLSKPQLSVAGLLPALLAYCSALDAQQAQGQVRWHPSV
jgi:hypothetical protein